MFCPSLKKLKETLCFFPLPPVSEKENYKDFSTLWTYFAATGVFPFMGAYKAAKAGLNHFAKNTAFEEASKGIRINVISPGAVATEILTTGKDRLQSKVQYNKKISCKSSSFSTTSYSSGTTGQEGIQ